LSLGDAMLQYAESMMKLVKMLYSEQIRPKNNKNNNKAKGRPALHKVTTRVKTKRQKKFKVTNSKILEKQD
jgi:hypothetical protein